MAMSRRCQCRFAILASWMAGSSQFRTTLGSGPEAPATLGETGDPTFCVMWTLTGVPAISIPMELGPAL